MNRKKCWEGVENAKNENGLVRDFERNLATGSQPIIRMSVLHSVRKWRHLSLVCSGRFRRITTIWCHHPSSDITCEWILCDLFLSVRPSTERCYSMIFIMPKNWKVKKGLSISIKILPRISEHFYNASVEKFRQNKFIW